MIFKKTGKNYKVKSAVFFTLLFMLLGPSVSGWELINAPASHTYPFDEMSNQNYLPHFLNALEKMHGITVFIHVSRGKGKIDLKGTADFLLRDKIKNQEGKFIYILAAPHLRQAAFAFSREAGGLFTPDDMRVLERHAAPALLGRWFIPEKKALSKIMGTIYYYLERNNLNPSQLKILREQAVITDGAWYRASLTEPFNTFIRLFYLEPISFIYYFPLVTFFLLVRMPGMYFGWYAYRNLSIAWVFFMILMAVMTGARVTAYVPEYIRVFSLLLGLNIPVGIYIMAFYSEHIQHAAYNYVTQIKGGFGAENEFEGKRWG